VVVYRQSTSAVTATPATARATLLSGVSPGVRRGGRERMRRQRGEGDEAHGGVPGLAGVWEEPTEGGFGGGRGEPCDDFEAYVLLCAVREVHVP